MPSDFVPDSGFVSARQSRGRRSHLAGMAAEEAVCRRYLDAGYDLVASRKRCPEGEIDLLLRLGGELAAVEVKQSDTHALALGNMRLRPSCVGYRWRRNAACWTWRATVSATCGWIWRW
ncbi:MAG: YraN family protein [Rhodobacter sp.]|nr:YraN family protein [Rhodobacter sp.]